MECSLKTFLIIILLLSGCGKSRIKADPVYTSKVQKLKYFHDQYVEEANALKDPDNGWITPDDCDGMIWTCKFAASRNVLDVDIRAAEYPGNPGKYGRRPAPYCWTKEGGDQGSKTEWSRDMAVAGLIPYAWLTKDLKILEEHALYGVLNKWKMGDPLDDGRTVYTPQVIGLLYKTIEALGGKKSLMASWPSVWTPGLTDYRAHLQMMQIWLQGEIAIKLNDADAMPYKADSIAMTTEVSETMYARIEEHAKREPSNPFYQAVYGLYSGNMDKAVDLLLDPSMPVGEYVRCDEYRRCQLAEWLFTSSIVLRHFGIP
jgi:hypothetical protein